MTLKFAVEVLRDDLLNVFAFIRSHYVAIALKSPEEHQAIERLDARVEYLRNLVIEGGKEDDDARNPSDNNAHE